MYLILGCSCSTKGTVVDTECGRLGGDCTCKPGVSGTRCDICMPGFYNFTDTGCVRK